MQRFSYIDKREVLQQEYSKTPILLSPHFWWVVNDHFCSDCSQEVLVSRSCYNLWYTLHSDGGALDGGAQCRMSNLRNPHVPCHHFCYFHVDFKMAPCQFKDIAYVMSFIISLLLIDPMSHVGFKKWPCHRVEFRGRGPQWSTCNIFLAMVHL